MLQSESGLLRFHYCPRLGTSPLMWKAVSTERDTSDLQFVSGRVRAASDDGRERNTLTGSFTRRA